MSYEIEPVSSFFTRSTNKPDPRVKDKLINLRINFPNTEIVPEEIKKIAAHLSLVHQGNMERASEDPILESLDDDDETKTIQTKVQAMLCYAAINLGRIPHQKNST